MPSFGLALLLATNCSVPATRARNVAVTDRGAVHGRALRTSHVYQGIPYAAAPTGSRRFRPPEPHACWSDVLETTAYGNVCPQLTAGSGVYTGDEDCLNLNIWAPDVPGGVMLPVIVFFHGGANLRNSSQAVIFGSRVHDGQYLAEHGRVVIVTVNTRLGNLGFLTHPSLDAESPHRASGNYGILDMIAALEWVQRNIAAFHGDRRRATVWGVSSGGINVGVLLASPLAKGLFSRAIIESGLFYKRATLPRAERSDSVSVARLHCEAEHDVAGCLRGATAEAVTRALVPEQWFVGGYRFGANVDGWVLPMQVLDALASPATHNHVPVLLGTGSDEGTTLAGATLWSGPLATPADYERAVHFQFGAAVGDGILGEYPVTSFDSPFYAFSAVITDAFMTCPTRTTARELSRTGRDLVWRYFYTHTWSSGSQVPNRAGHQTDLGFSWHNLNQDGFTPTAAETALADAFTGYWTRFASRGDPNGGAAVRWPQHDAARDTYLVLDDTIHPMAGLRTARCDFWDSISLPSTGPDAHRR